MDYTEKARAVFSADIFATEAAGIVIDEARENYARCSMKLARHHQNAAGGVMGGALFTLADFAFAVAANIEKMNTVALTSSIAFNGAAKGGTLTAVAGCIKAGRSTCYYNITIMDELGTLVATVTTTGFIKN